MKMMDIRMKRPLCFLCVIYAALLAAALSLWPPEAYECMDREGQSICVMGRIRRAEKGTSTTALYLTDISLIEAFDDSDTGSGDFSTQTTDRQLRTKPLQPKGILCYLKEAGRLRIGQWVRVRGKIKNFRRPGNPGEFDQAFYYMLQGMSFQMTGCSVIAAGAWDKPVQEALYQARCKMEAVFYGALDVKDASVLSAMLLGSKQSMDRDVKVLYQAAGIAHVLAISGLHISLLGMGLYRLLLRCGCGKKTAVLISIPAIYAYGVMTGMSASGKRAVFMFVIQLGAIWLGRTYDMLTALAAAAVLLLQEQPLYLYYSGFQLSFGAVAGIGLLAPALRGPWAAAVGGKRKKMSAVSIGEGISASLSVSLMTLPVIVQNYCEIPTYSLLMNSIVLPLMGILLAAGLCLLAASTLAPFLTPAAAAVCSGILSFYEFLCRVCLQLPGSRRIVGHADRWQVAVYYVLLFAAAVLLGKGSKNKCSGLINLDGCKRKAVTGILTLMCAVFLLLIRIQPYPVRIHMLDVGQGDCFLIQAGDCNIMIDGGSSSDKNAGTYQILPALKYYGAERLDYVFVTHLDKDHYSGILELLEGAAEDGAIPVCRLILPQNAQPSEAYHRLKLLIQAQGGSVYGMSAGEEVILGGLSLACYHPLKGEAVQDTNDTSLVLSVAYESFRGLFMGDLGMTHEDEVVQQIEENRQRRQDSGTKREKWRDGYTVLKVGHHGSRNSTSEGLLEAVRPGIALLSYGAGNSYGHPHAETLSRLDKALVLQLNSAVHGAVTVATDGERVFVETFRQNYSQ